MRLLLCLLCLSLFACGSDDDNNNGTQTEDGYTVETVAEAPAWQVDWSGSVSRPDWQEPAVQGFENFAIALIKIEDALQPYATDDDLMALFVDGELRGVTPPARGADGGSLGATAFLLKAYGNEADGEYVDVTLRYWNSRLRQLFSRSATMRFSRDEVYGIGEDFVPQFTLGAASFPVVTYLDITPADLPMTDVTYGEGDLLAAFNGNECRGLSSFNAELSAFNTLAAFGREEGERYTLRYWNAATGRLFTINKTF